MEENESIPTADNLVRFISVVSYVNLFSNAVLRTIIHWRTIYLLRLPIYAIEINLTNISHCSEVKLIRDEHISHAESCISIYQIQIDTFARICAKRMDKRQSSSQISSLSMHATYDIKRTQEIKHFSDGNKVIGFNIQWVYLLCD